MKQLHIQGSRMDPRAQLDPEKGLIELSGYSSPDDTTSAYAPILNWIEAYKNAPREKTVLTFKMRYYNTATSKMFLNIMQSVLEIEQMPGYEVEINWYFDEEDEDMEEAAEDFEDILEHQFNKIAYNS